MTAPRHRDLLPASAEPAPLQVIKQPAVAPQTVPQILPQQITIEKRAVPPQVTPQAPRSVKKEFYQVSTTARANLIEDNVVAKSSGIITNLNTDKKEYEKGERILTLENYELDGRIDQLTAALQIQEAKLADLKILFDTQAASQQELNQVQEQVQETQQQLDKARQEKALGIVTAPHKLKVRDFQVTDGMNASDKQPLLSYYDQERERIDIQVPVSVNYFDDINLSLNGEPAAGVSVDKWSPTPSLQNLQVDLIVTPQHLSIGEKVKVNARFNFPEHAPNVLNSITGKTRATVTVGKIEEYPLTASAEGPVKFLVREGDNVRAGQLLAQVEANPYQLQLEDVNRQIQNINLQLTQNAPSTEGTQYMQRSDLDNLKIQKAGLLAEQKTLRIEIDRTNIRAPGDGLIDWSAEHGAKIFKGGDELFLFSTGSVYLGDINNSINPNNAILFSKALALRAGDPIAVETPRGILLPGEVASVNKSPYNALVDLQQYQSIEVKVYDSRHALRPGLPVQVIVPTEKEKQVLLSAANHLNSPQLSSASPSAVPASA